MNIKPLPAGSIFWESGTKYHVVGHVMDGNNIVYVIKSFGTQKRWWHYETKTHWELELLAEYPNLLTKIIRKRKTEKI